MRSFQCDKIHGAVKIRDPAFLKRKLAAFRDKGPSELQIVTDFDQTLTRQSFNDMKEGDSTFKLIHNWSGTPSEAT